MHDLPADLREEFRARGFSRRRFGRLAAALTASASLPFYGEPALAQNGPERQQIPILLDNNENPLGPCRAALEAVAEIAPQCGRYGATTNRHLAEVFAGQEGLDPTYVSPYAGSSDPMVRTVLAFASPTRGLAVAAPTFEAAERAAEYFGAAVTRTPLKRDHSHDLRAMLAAAPTAGLFYVCNPNNPTGTLTPHAEIEQLANNKPEGAVVLVDEAYINYTDERSSIDLVKQDLDVVVLRTFSKLYGMAGLRCGLAIGKPDLLSKIARFGARWPGYLPATAMAAGAASLQERGLAGERKKILEDIRGEAYEFLAAHGLEYIPSVANFFMFDVRRDAREVVEALRKQGVRIGRVWSSRPHHCRVSVGTREEMAQFQSALLRVLG